MFAPDHCLLRVDRRRGVFRPTFLVLPFSWSSNTLIELKHQAASPSEGLLQTDIGFIAANETHAVFSIRVPRAWLAENHFFLNVLSDVAGGDSGCNCRYRRNQWRGLAG